MNALKNIIFFGLKELWLLSFNKFELLLIEIYAEEFGKFSRGRVNSWYNA